MASNHNPIEPRRARNRSPGAHPPWLLLWLLVPVVAWLLVAVLPWVDVESPGVRRLCRDLGYVVLAAMIVPYLFAWRRLSLHRPRGHITRWMRWHIGAAYLASGLIVVHARGHLFRHELTSVIVVLLAVVMLSGMLGMLIQKTVFRLMALTLDEELGLLRLHVERQRLVEEAERLVANYSMLTESDIHDWPGFCSKLLEEGSKANAKVWNNKMFPHAPRAIVRAAVASRAEPKPKDVLIAAMNELLRTPDFCNKMDFKGLSASDEASALARRSSKELTDPEIERRNRLYLELSYPEHFARSRKPPETVGRFFEESIAGYLRSEFPSWGWLFHGAALEPVSRNRYLRVRALADPEQAGMIDQLWNWVQRRRQMDLEYWLQRLARAWLLIHVPAAWPLLVLVLYHVAWSIYHGGFF